VTLVNRFVVPGTANPVIHVGHRAYRKGDGTEAITKTYTAEWSVSGKQRRKSLKTRNKTAAVKMAHELHAKICNGDRLEAPKEHTVDDAITLYLETCDARRLKPKTITAYTHTLERLREFCRDRPVPYLNRFGQIEFWGFVGTMRQLSKKTVYNRSVIVQQFFKWCYEDAELIPENPIRGIKLTKPESKKQPCFTPEQVRQLIDNADEYLRPIIAFLVFTGCRVGEMRDLLWEDVQLDANGNGVLHINRGGGDDETKGRASRRIPIHAELRPYLEALPRIDHHVFHSRPSARHPMGNGKVVDTRLLDQVKALCEKCGFENPGQYKTHTFRHTFASMLARQNVSYKYALQLMGHSSSKILDMYFSVYDEDAVKAIQAIQLPRAEPGQY